MACFSLAFIENILIWLVILGAVVAIVKLVLPYLLGPLGAPGTIVFQILNILLWAVIAIFLIVVVFDLLSCLMPIGGGLRLR
jgi:hypothetical protein